MSSANNPPPESWNGLAIAAVAWVGGLFCWLGLLGLNSFLFLIPISGTGGGKKSLPVSLLDSPFLHGSLYGLSFFTAAYFVGKRSRDRRAPLYVFYGYSFFLALLLLLDGQSRKTPPGPDPITLFVPLFAAPLGAWLASFRCQPRPTSASPAR